MKTLETVIRSALRGYILPVSLNLASAKVARAVRRYLKERK